MDHKSSNLFPTYRNILNSRLQAQIKWWGLSTSWGFREALSTQRLPGENLTHLHIQFSKFRSVEAFIMHCNTFLASHLRIRNFWWREPDSNRRLLGYEPNELPLLHPAKLESETEFASTPIRNWIPSHVFHPFSHRRKESKVFGDDPFRLRYLFLNWLPQCQWSLLFRKSPKGISLLTFLKYLTSAHCLACL